MVDADLAALDRDGYVVPATASQDARTMVGYSAYPPVVGAVDGMHPARLLSSGS